MDRRLVLYGCGRIGAEWLEHLGSENVYVFADSDERKVGKRINGKEVISVNKLAEMDDQISIFIATSYLYKAEIYRLLTEKNLNRRVVGVPLLEGEVYADWNTYVDTGTRFEGRNALLSGVQLYRCSLGFSSYISPDTIFRNVKIGKYTSVGPNVRMIVGQHPTRNFVSIHPIFYSTQQTIGKSYVSENLFDEFRYTKSGWTIEIGNDVWIGDGSTIMEGVTVADGTVVAAGANVVKDTEPYSIVGGNPARLIRYRFEREDIDFLLSFRWWDKGERWVDEHAEYFDDIKKFRRAQEGAE